MRFDKLIGTVLLWIPSAWALWLANNGLPPVKLVAYFFLGTVVMRAAGCVINDIADRHIDKHVSRTSTRPMAKGEVGLIEALVIFVILLLIALIIVLQLPIICFYEAQIALLLTIVYPFCKRFFQAPQFILGLAFSMGIPMAYSASLVDFDIYMVVLFVISLLWIVAYDTMYALIDKEEDLLIGVKSSAILFAKYSRKIIALLHIIMQILWLYIARIIAHSNMFYVFWLIAGGILAYQHVLLAKKNREDYFRGFLLNGWYGTVMWIGIFNIPLA